MNLSTIVGLVLGVVFIVISIVLGGDISNFVNWPSVMIVVGGTISATIASYSFDRLKKVTKRVKDAFITPKVDIKWDIENLISYADTARKEGLLALDGQEYTNDFMKKGIELVVDGTEGELVKDIMESEIDVISKDEDIAPSILNAMSAYSPAFGMVGTLIGLINMLRSLDDMNTIGASMATALITTLYGVLMANLIFTPLARKLQVCADLVILRYEIMLEGILSIQNGENPRIIREKLYSLVEDKNMLIEEEIIEDEGIYAQEEAATAE